MKTASLDPTAEQLGQAERMLLVSSLAETATAFQDGKLVSLMPVKEGQVIVTRGKLGEDCLNAHLGVSALPILMPHTRASFL
jgi:hypothetical protein